MNVIFLNEAEQELLETALFYEKQARGLGKNFMSDVSPYNLAPNSLSSFSASFYKYLVRNWKNQVFTIQLTVKITDGK
jgi:hypothetical protein